MCSIVNGISVVAKLPDLQLVPTRNPRTSHGVKETMTAATAAATAADAAAAAAAAHKVRHASTCQKTYTLPATPIWRRSRAYVFLLQKGPYLSRLSRNTQTTVLRAFGLRFCAEMYMCTGVCLHWSSAAPKFVSLAILLRGGCQFGRQRPALSSPRACAAFRFGLASHFSCLQRQRHAQHPSQCQ